MKMKSLNLLNDFRTVTKTYYVSEKEIVLDNTKSYQYECDLCDARYGWKNGLTSHRRKVHLL